MTIRTLLFTLLLFTCAILTALGIASFTTIQSFEIGQTVTRRAMLTVTSTTLSSLQMQATLFAQATKIIREVTQTAQQDRTTTRTPQRVGTLSRSTVMAQATEIIRAATQTGQAEKTRTRTP